MISSSEQKKKRPRAFLFLCKQGRGKNRAKRDVEDAVPYTRFNIPSRRAGPACPAAGYAFFGGTHGSRPTGAYPPPTKTTRRPARGAAGIAPYGRAESSAPTSCHSEPVRAAKQVPLGYRLAWESVSQRGGAALTGRCGHRPLQNGTGRAHAGGQSRPPLYSAKRDGCRRLFLFSYTAVPRR